MNESINNQAQEKIPPGLEPVKLPDNSFPIRRALMDHVDGHISGFEDILFGEALGAGAGGYFNTSGPTFQLVFALSIVPNDNVVMLLNRNKESNPREIVTELRKIRPLSGMKIIDLGCGLPTFALAAGTLGAEVYTADHGPKFSNIKAKLTGHTDIDLNDEDALQILQKVTGGEFDLVTEYIINATHHDSDNLQAPSKQTILRLGDGLLKKGGYLYSLKVGQNKPLRKK